jgi:hypothetical protein
MRTHEEIIFDQWGNLTQEEKDYCNKNGIRHCQFCGDVEHPEELVILAEVESEEDKKFAQELLEKYPKLKEIGYGCWDDWKKGELPAWWYEDRVADGREN